MMRYQRGFDVKCDVRRFRRLVRQMMRVDSRAWLRRGGYTEAQRKAMHDAIRELKAINKRVLLGTEPSAG